jgi:DNA-binding transcriptional ArsR family regulator
VTSSDLDPLIHVPTRLKIVATLAALPDGDALSFTRLQEMLGLTPGNLIVQLRKLEEAEYISSHRTGSGPGKKTTVALTRRAGQHSVPTSKRCAICSAVWPTTKWPPRPAAIKLPSERSRPGDSI